MGKEQGFGTGELKAIVDIVKKDTSRLSVVVPELILFDSRSRRGTTAKAKQLARHPHGVAAAHALLAQFGTHSFRLEDDQVERAAASVLREVQGDICLLLGREWPQLSEPAGPVVTLKPDLDSQGRGGWFAGLYECCSIGQLGSAVGDKIRW
ncbi:hypothetical protein [Leifsonia sp. NPDC058248]|uniref:hypothetical protein n=1 Tax=Leifsonia sp. NPDC058248 TaxID=3346402 RepID=UPI0036D9CD89